jgi:outer membrane protein insertion porin family
MRMSVRLWWLILCLLPAAGYAAEAGQSYAVDQVQIEGNRRIDSEAIRQIIKAQKGSVAGGQIDEDIKALYRTGYFDQVTASIVASDAGRQSLKYFVVEKPVARKVFILGNEELSESDLSDVLKFEGKRFVDKVVPIGENQVDVTFNVKEGKRYRIRGVKLAGLSKIEEDDVLGLLQTKRYKWWSSWLFGTGRVNADVLQNDKLIVQQYLIDHGFIDGKVSDAAVVKVENGLEVVFSASEGAEYRLGKISAAGDLIDGSQKKTLKGIKSKSGGVFCGSCLREDSFIVSDKFADRGYAFVNVVPDTKVDRAGALVDVSFESSKGRPVTIDRIRIKGNNKTYDNVIRREIRVAEQELYSASKIRRSQAMLERLGYFEEVNIGQEPAKEPDKLNLDVNVREGSTGAFSVGAGYSTGDGFIVNTQVSENNFFGMGRQVMMNVDWGTQRDNMVLSYLDNRFRDSFWSLGADVYRTNRQFQDFDRRLTGGGFRFGYPLENVWGVWAQDMSFSIKYEYMGIDISDVNPLDAAPLVVESQGKSTASVITPQLVRNTINNPLNPSRGSRQVLSFETAGLGGEEEYWVGEFNNQYYVPLLHGSSGDLVFAWRFKLGYGQSFNDDPFPLFRRYFPGGINSVRGYKDRTLGPTDDQGHEYGGSKQVVDNLELIFPLVNSAGLKGVVFYDVGQAYDDDETMTASKLRQAYGFGIRWTSPLGPIRVEFGFPVDRRDGEESMVTLFSFGAPM